MMQTIETLICLELKVNFVLHGRKPKTILMNESSNFNFMTLRQLRATLQRLALVPQPMAIFRTPYTPVCRAQCFCFRSHPLGTCPLRPFSSESFLGLILSLPRRCTGGVVATKCYIADRRPRLKTHFILRPRNAKFYYLGTESDADACELPKTKIVSLMIGLSHCLNQ